MKTSEFLLKTGFVAILLLSVGAQISAQKIKIRKTRLISGANGEVTAHDIAGKRDLNKYAQGGHFDCRIYVLSREKRQCDLSAFRLFLWENWSKKTRAYVRLTENSPDAGATAHYFIEPDEKGAWTIVRRLARWGAIPPGVSEIVDFPRIYRVEQRADEGDARGWRLVFKDQSGAPVFEQ